MDVWQSIGVERSHFQSLVSLLSLRNGGQLEHSSSDLSDPGDEPGDSNSVNSSDSIINNPVSEGKYDALRKRFLDRLAELFSQEDDPRFVVAAAMRELPSDEGVDVYMARNHGFHKEGRLRKEDEDMFNIIQEALGKVSLRASGELSISSMYPEVL